MYSFGPIPKYRRSGHVIGTHQKIDRVARRHFSVYEVEKLAFPSIRDILHFEGIRGPDGVKLKSPGQDEPKHFIDPEHITDNDELIVAIKSHSHNLTEALRSANTQRAAFEAAWLAHAVTDGLTPAHHDPFDEQVRELKHTGKHAGKVRSKVIMSGGGSKRQAIKNNWAYWGAKGIMTTHTLFEAGVATSTKALKFQAAELTEADIARIKKDGFMAVYIDMIHDVDALGMYAQFKRDGWTHALVRTTAQTLMPMIIKAVVLAWYEAYTQASEKQS